VFRTDVNRRQQAAEIRVALAELSVKVRLGPIGTVYYDVHPDDRAHLEQHDGGRPGCPDCAAIWRLAQGGR
jgi:hypothetical protein